MKPEIIFIHGMFLTGKCWEHWMPFFEQRGYRCTAPNWPLHESDPATLRADIPPGLGSLELETLVDFFSRAAAAKTHPPILIGHSLGGLVAQIVQARGLAAAAVCVSTVAPNAMLSADWDFLKNSASIANPLKGDDPFLMTPEGFHQTFANTLSRAESDRAYQRYAVHESRQVLRDAMGRAGHVELDRPHAPLLFVAGEKDEIIPAKLVGKVADAYQREGSVTDFRVFPNRDHFIAGDPGWEEVAGFVADWLDATQAAGVSVSASVIERTPDA